MKTLFTHFLTHLLTLSMLVLMSLQACRNGQSKQADNDKVQDDQQARQSNTDAKSSVRGRSDALQLMTINLSKVTQVQSTQAALVSASLHTEPCESIDDNGAFAIPLKLACMSNHILTETLYGKKAADRRQPQANCEAYRSGVGSHGILGALACEPSLQEVSEIVSVRWQEGKRAMAASFVDMDPLDDIEALGAWTNGGDANRRYPANIQLFSAPKSQVITQSDSGLDGLVALKLASAGSGDIFYNLISVGVNLHGTNHFSVADNEDVCAGVSDQAICAIQEVAFRSQDANTGVITGIHLRVVADNPDDPQTMMIEGELTISEAQAKKWWGKSETFLQPFIAVRSIYFRTIRKGDFLWGSFDFKDANGQSLGLDIAKTESFLLRDGHSAIKYAGVCRNLKTQEEEDTCDAIDSKAYAHHWLGDDAVNAPEASYQLPVTFTDAPSAAGIVVK